MQRTLDSSVLIDVLRGVGDAIEFVAGLEVPPLCSEVSRVEVLRGLRSDERLQTSRLLDTLEWHPVDQLVARRAGELGRRWRSSHPGIETVDLIVAATAELTSAELATSNLRHFPMFSGLEPPY